VIHAKVCFHRPNEKKISYGHWHNGQPEAEVNEPSERHLQSAEQWPLASSSG
jgi:hypothetical protein